MQFRFSTQQQASVQLLQVIWYTDYKCSWHPTGIIATEYVYFNPVQCRFYFRSEQERTDKDVVRQLVKRYSVNEPYNAVEIVATKYPFSKLILGAVVYRKIISYREFFNLVREKPELF